MLGRSCRQWMTRSSLPLSCSSQLPPSIVMVSPRRDLATVSTATYTAPTSKTGPRRVSLSLTSPIRNECLSFVDGLFRYYQVSNQQVIYIWVTIWVPSPIGLPFSHHPPHRPLLTRTLLHLRLLHRYQQLSLMQHHHV
jgi:hypothetical protein